MRKSRLQITSVLTVLFNFAVVAQNLVPNPGFENYSVCPSSSGQLNACTGNWFGNAFQTPDYFNACNPNSTFLGSLEVGVPNNLFGFQYAASGNGYAGILAFDYFFPEGREFFSTQLTAPLTIGTRYFVSFKANPAWSPFASVDLACNNIGIRFSVDNILDTLPMQLNIAQVYSAAVLNDTMNWTVISGSFIATDTSRYITIGNLFDDAATQTQSLGQPGTGVAYYFIDDVCVSADSSICNDFTVGTKHAVGVQQIQVFPNPATDQVAIDLPFSIIKPGCKLVVKNALGQEVLTLDRLSQRLIINVAELGSAGIYFFELVDSTLKSLGRTKLIVR